MTTRSEGRTQIYFMAAVVGLIVIGVVYLVLGLVRLIRPGKGGGDDGAKR